MIELAIATALVDRWRGQAAKMDEDDDTQAGCALGLRKAAEELAGLVDALGGAE